MNTSDGYIKRSDIPWVKEGFQEGAHNDRWTEIKTIAYKEDVDRIPSAPVVARDSYDRLLADIDALRRIIDMYRKGDDRVAKALGDLKRLEAENKELLSAGKKMHLWIFRNTVDEKAAYDECGLTDEQNALFGYGGRLTIEIPGEQEGQ